MERYNKVIGNYEALQRKEKQLLEKITKSVISCEKLEECLCVMMGFSEWMNRFTKEKLESITNIALGTIFPEKPMSFKVQANRTKKGTFYDLYIETDGVITDLLEAKGGGVVDVVQMCMRITYLVRLKSILRQTLILDEPFKNLDAHRVGLASEWLKQVSETLGIQFLLVTHIPSLILTVEKNGSVEIRNTNGVSQVV